MDTNHLAQQIACAARLDMGAAEFLADYAIAGGYTGGALHVGLGELNYSTVLYAVIYPVCGRWYIAAGWRLPDGRFKLSEAGNGQEAQTLRWSFHFERHCDHFDTFTPDMPPVGVPVVDLPEPDDSEPGYVYVLKLDAPLGNDLHSARYYTGWAKNLDGRLYHHARGSGSHFTRAAVERGIGWQVVYSAPGTRRDERAIKNYKCVRRWLAAQAVQHV